MRILQAALARDRRGEYQIQAAIAALHDDARTAEEADWPQIVTTNSSRSPTTRLAASERLDRRPAGG